MALPRIGINALDAIGDYRLVEIYATPGTRSLTVFWQDGTRTREVPMRDGGPLDGWILEMKEYFVVSPAEDAPFTVRAKATLESGEKIIESFTISFGLETGEGETLLGSRKSDAMFAGPAGNVLDGQRGNDDLRGSEGADTLLGGQGADMLSGGAGDDALSGGAAADTLSGDDGADTLSGREGADLLAGGAGNDTLSGGRGADTVFAGEGADTISVGRDGGSDVVVLDALGAGVDIIASFDTALDSILLPFPDNSTQIAIGRAPQAMGAGCWVLYDTATGWLSVDLDGEGGADAELAAIFLGKQALTAENFLFF